MLSQGLSSIILAKSIFKDRCLPEFVLSCLHFHDFFKAVSSKGQSIVNLFTQVLILYAPHIFYTVSFMQLRLPYCKIIVVIA